MRWFVRPSDRRTGRQERIYEHDAVWPVLTWLLALHQSSMPNCSPLILPCNRYQSFPLDVTYCPAFWDTLLCWPNTAAGENVTKRCPNIEENPKGSFFPTNRKKSHIKAHCQIVQSRSVFYPSSISRPYLWGSVSCLL